jgi:hypothetical protein
MEFVIILIITVFIGFFILVFYFNSRKIKVIKEEKEAALKEYTQIKNSISIPDNSLKISCFQTKTINGKTINKAENYVWIKDGKIWFFPAKWNIEFYYDTKIKYTQNPEYFEEVFAMANKCDVIELCTIDIKDIISFEKTGDRYFENQISGGGGGGSSIKKAIVGGVVAGTAGAIVASRKEINPISSEFVEHDERICILYFYQDNIKQTLIFEHAGYNDLKELIPEKDIKVVDEIKRSKIIEKQLKKEDNIINDIENLGKLLDKGLITQKEFEKMKKKIIGNK